MPCIAIAAQALAQATEAQITGSPWNTCAKARLHRPACAPESSPQRLEVGRERCWKVARRLGGIPHPWDGTASKGHPTAACAVPAKPKPLGPSTRIGDIMPAAHLHHRRQNRRRHTHFASRFATGGDHDVLKLARTHGDDWPGELPLAAFGAHPKQGLSSCVYCIPERATNRTGVRSERASNVLRGLRNFFSPCRKEVPITMRS